MKFSIITHVVHKKEAELYFGYAPYIREMNVWLKYFDEVNVVAPLSNEEPIAIDLAYLPNKLAFVRVTNFNFTNFRNSLNALGTLPLICWRIFWVMKAADHIHLRCPGNMGMLGCIIQVFFPFKSKTAKYAGNWDPYAKQPVSYRLQKWILSNTFLTRNMKVLVYGEWEKKSKNIVPFFTASYSVSELLPLSNIKLTDPIIRLLYVGTLSAGKNPLYAIQLVQQLRNKGHRVVLDLYGEGELRSELETYITEQQLQEGVFILGNQNAEVIKSAYQKSHFVILPSKSEGWPKAIAEGMFWGCVPLSTTVSCVRTMLGDGERGLLLHMDLKKDVAQIELLLNDAVAFEYKRKRASNWSREYTIEYFEAEIKKCLHKSYQ